VTTLTESGRIIGLGDSDTYDTITFQIDVASKKGVFCDIDVKQHKIDASQGGSSGNTLTLSG